MRPRLTTLLFDLDGTLLDVDMTAFLGAFFPLAAGRFGTAAERQRIVDALIAAARLMMTTRAGDRTLDEVFLASFSREVGRSPEETRQIFAAFHREEFERMHRLTRPFADARPLLDRARAFGYELVIATNPVFFLDAVRARIRWAGLADLPFRLVTAAENMRHAKPQAGYFAEILGHVDRRPEECLMVGNDSRMDMAAGGLGIGTWLVTRPGGDEGPRLPGPAPDRSGTLAELEGWLHELGPVSLQL